MAVGYLFSCRGRDVSLGSMRTHGTVPTNFSAMGSPSPLVALLEPPLALLAATSP